MSDILDKIVAVKRDEISRARRQRDLASLRRDAESLGGKRDFIGALRRDGIVGDRYDRQTDFVDVREVGKAIQARS